ncbi:serine hydrolase domain-containing protein [Allorhizocola rhizosphaerae]|uniref:serine hydrolase domain-containing protein n=1 Tax=Allorhizocola rhizosphaerae TaxID=1872709 RepID=UPI0013C32A3A|nr:serine hydrolase domain-containing protein [Allorhizocola rhizosphaerae]
MRANNFGAVLGVLIGCVTVVAAAPAHAAPLPECAVVGTPGLAEFLDDAVPRLLRQDRIPGAVVSVVSAGSTAFAKGYGMANVEDAVAFDASRSLVRIASITKLFTWTAVMQQVEAGRLDLDTDVNKYLKGFQIPAIYPQPVTLQHLMDHTAGFEDYSINVAARSAAAIPPLGRYLAEHMPARIRPPGEISAYSNYGAALAGHIVAEVSGEPYDAYVQRHLLDPLGMSRSTAAQPVPSTLVADLARSYNTDSDPPQPIPFTFDNLPPDGSISATAVDMARFMNAHLHPGSVLSPATAARMHQRSFAADPRLDGYAHGFKERTINGHRVLTHDGGWEGFRSMLMLAPGCDLGIFLSLNGTGVGAGAAQFIDAFFDHFSPAADAPARTAEAAAAPLPVAAPRAGFYQPTRHNESTVEKVASVLGPSRLTVDGDGTVRFKGKQWTTQGDGLYRATDGSDRLVFLAGSRGRLYAATDGPAYEMMTRSEELPFNLLILLAYAIPALAALAMPVAWAVRRIRRRPSGLTATWRAARILAASAAGIGAIFLLNLLATLVGNTDEFLYNVPLSFRLLLCLPLLALGTGAASIALTVKGWRGSAAGVVSRIHQIGLLAGLLALTWFLWQWNLIGWQF